jgi:hypothetical protein
MGATKVTTDANLHLRIQVRIPSLPNFLVTVDGRPIDVKDIPDATLQKIGERWTEKLLEHARTRKGILDP